MAALFHSLLENIKRHDSATYPETNTYAYYHTAAALFRCHTVSFCEVQRRQDLLAAEGIPDPPLVILSPWQERVVLRGSSRHRANAQPVAIVFKDHADYSNLKVFHVGAY